MASTVRASVIVNSFNYGRFLGQAIDSALCQRYADTEVVVVDDGSTDNSCDIIASYGRRIIPVVKENGGQASAFNAGFRVSRGEIVLFLDSDDMLLPTAVEKAVKLFSDPRVVKVHWPLRIIDEHGRYTGKVFPRALPEGDLRKLVIQGGPTSCISPPTTGNAWARSYLDRVLPVPETPYYSFCPDEYLFNLAPVCGLIRRIPRPQALYRIHGKNNYAGKAFEDRLEMELRGYDEQCQVMTSFFRAMGINANVERWKRKSWFYRLRQAVDEISSVVPKNETLVLVDEDRWATRELDGRRCVPFGGRAGAYWGPPTSDRAAVRELVRLRKSGANFVVFGWPAFWWLDHYSGLRQFLRSQSRCVLKNERILVFDLRA